MRFIHVLIVIVLIGGCTKDKASLQPIDEGGIVLEPLLPSTPYSYQDTLPAHMQSGVLDFFDSTPLDNPTTDEGAALGRVLFYDKQLSANNTVACASCHKQEYAFSDPNQFSEGHLGGVTGRNSMSTVNMRWGGRFFWDLRANGLEAQVLMPIQDPLEMGMTLTGLVQKLNDLTYYKPLFYNAFGDSAITSDRISRALAQFVRSIVSYRSKYDEGVQTNFANFTAQELNGRALFYNGQTRCNQCHQTDNFFSTISRNNGLDSVYTDNGVGALNGNQNFNGHFKTVTIRNVELTGPYMHDGRFATLEEVVDQYADNLAAHPQLSDQLTTNLQNGGPPIQISLTSQERADLVAFMKTLTDWDLIQDLRFSNPFPE